MGTPPTSLATVAAPMSLLSAKAAWTGVDILTLVCSFIVALAARVKRIAAILLALLLSSHSVR